jgi:hypothetical protein
MKKKDRKIGTMIKRHKVNSELKKVVDQQENVEDVEELTMTAYQNKNDQGWVKVEIPIIKKKI